MGQQPQVFKHLMTLGIPLMPSHQGTTKPGEVWFVRYKCCYFRKSSMYFYNTPTALVFSVTDRIFFE